MSYIYFFNAAIIGLFLALDKTGTSAKYSNLFFANKIRWREW